MQYAAPSSAFGYYRGNPQFMGYGSGQGQNVAGSGTFAQGQGPVSASTTGWTPTILYLFVLIIAELFVFAFLSRHV